MRRFIGIAVFAVAAAVAFYIHFNKVAKVYVTRRVQLNRIEAGSTDTLVNADDCQEVSRYEGRFVRLEGTVKKILSRKVELGCLEVIFHTKKIPQLKLNDRVLLKGFVKLDRGVYYVDIWDATFFKRR